MSCVIMDDIERLMDYTPIGPRFSNTVLQGLKVLVTKRPPTDGRKIFVLATTSCKEFIDESGLQPAFQYAFQVPELKKPAEKEAVLREVFHVGDGVGAGGITEQQLKECSSAATLDIGVKRLIRSAKLAQHQAGSGDMSTGLLEALALRN
jgi:vesicle-fusing ATPase